MGKDAADQQLKRRLDRARLRGTYLLILVMIATAAPSSSWAWYAGGAGLALLGGLLRALAAGTIVKNEELSTDGVYRLCRNPLYLGSFLIYTGFVLMSGWWFFLPLLWAWFWWIYHLTISREEELLCERYPDRYPEFMENVPRFLPRPGSVVTMLRTVGTFSWQRYLENKEYEGGTLAVLTALIMGLLRPGELLGLTQILPDFLHLP